MFIERKTIESDTITKLFNIKTGECFKVVEALPGFDTRNIYMRCGDYKDQRYKIINLESGGITQLHESIQVLPIKCKIVAED